MPFPDLQPISQSVCLALGLLLDELVRTSLPAYLNMTYAELEALELVKSEDNRVSNDIALKIRVSIIDHLWLSPHQLQVLTFGQL